MDAIAGHSRTKNTWNVTLQKATGEIVETTFSAYWDHEQDWVPNLVASSAAAKAWFESCPHDAQQRVGHAPISAALVID